ncbi:uncharacterized protein TM35_000721180 [Trypanosoma theileri]|uniref:Complement component 3 CUB domain-containing protein n=1 Tax=Trypanosoma theileri TaxID=67003 RepID=A0A1X0NFB9_9TRYP|nr:uncharacterized protein TM35_000721180 [Trypanosoma theileri]ORC83415.1 hypothetical protein TM35_000721180 [Trypanosoma theileri]
MVMMRFVLCILALLLSCACVHVLAEEVPAADLSDQVPDTESETKGGNGPGSDGKCPEGTELSDNKTCTHKKPEAPPAKVPEVPKKPGLDASTDEQHNHHQSETLGQGTAQSLPGAVSSRGEDGLEDRGVSGAPGQVGDHGSNGSSGAGAGSPTGAVSESAAPTTTESEAEAAGISRSGSSDNSSTGETTARQGSESTEASTSSPSSSPTESARGADAETPNNATSSAERESTDNQNETGNTETTTSTTTTTTTLPPELTNNKKGDADSSSSISSSVWVRVPLLIVVTLACILVC